VTDDQSQGEKKGKKTLVMGLPFPLWHFAILTLKLDSTTFGFFHFINPGFKLRIYDQFDVHLLFNEQLLLT